MSMGKMMVSEARLVKRLGLRPHVIANEEKVRAVA